MSKASDSTGSASAMPSPASGRCSAASSTVRTRSGKAETAGCRDREAMDGSERFMTEAAADRGRRE